MLSHEIFNPSYCLFEPVRRPLSRSQVRARD